MEAIRAQHEVFHFDGVMSEIIIKYFTQFYKNTNLERVISVILWNATCSDQICT